MCGCCLEDVGRLSEGMERLSGGCGEVVLRVCEAVWRVWGSCLVSVQRLSGGCGEAV